MMTSIAFIRRLAAVMSLAALSLWPMLGHATCTRTSASQTGDTRTAQIAFGRINMTDTYLQPVGTMLASVVVPPTQYTYNGATAATVLWNCDLADLPNLYFLAATNGDDRLGGFWETGAADGLPGVYATWLSYVGIKLTMSGVTLSRYWQRIPLTTYAVSGNRIQIRLQDVPTMQAELYRISSLPPATGAVSNYCPTMGSASAAGTVYTCIQPNAYIQLVGPGIGHDEIGEDSAYRYDFFGALNGFGYGMRQATSLSQVATCVARSATPHVLFSTVSAQQLQAGAVTQANFSVQVECSNSVSSGTASGQTALGIQVSPGAYRAAQSLGLVNASGGVTALVSDNYGNDTGLAQGVGITLENATTGNTMVFVGQPGITGSVPSANPSGAGAGWYPVLEGASSMGATQSGYTHYLQTFTATLRQLPSHLAQPGKVYATAYVLVKVQ